MKFAPTARCRSIARFAIHLNPVSTSSYATPSSLAIAPIMGDETRKALANAVQRRIADHEFGTLAGMTREFLHCSEIARFDLTRSIDHETFRTRFLQNGTRDRHEWTDCIDRNRDSGIVRRNDRRAI